MKHFIFNTIVLLTAVSAVFSAVGCLSNNNDGISGSLGTSTFVQIERLGNPGVNEALIITNTNLNAWNSVGPADDLGSSDAAAAIRTEAVSTLTALGNNSTQINAIVAGFLPDMMRVDTTASIAVGSAAFGSHLNTSGRPDRGRKLEDDVVDVALSVLTSGAITTDNVAYPISTAPDPTKQGHHLLVGQGAPLGSATFPFLATPY